MSMAVALEKIAELSAEAQEIIKKAEKIAIPPNPSIYKTFDLETLTRLNLEKCVTSKETAVKSEAGLATQEYDETGFRPLTIEEAKALQEATGMSDATVSRCSINEDGQIKLRCTNEDKALNEPAEGEAKYTSKVVEVGGYLIEIVMPEFDGLFEVTVPENMYTADDYSMFKYCTELLNEAIMQNPELAQQFTDKQLEQIKSGSARISGLTWHHAAECGKMQLVPTSVHEGNRHTGGKAIWGGGRP